MARWWSAALAIGALSRSGPLAIGALAIGRLRMAGKVRLKDVEIDRLVVRKLSVLERGLRRVYPPSPLWGGTDGEAVRVGKSR